ncbi:MAG: Glycosylphosphatidylinositol (GPI) anchor assembly protein [Heterodermia speciosa]|uniref:Glycosylphosphatidylinositol (GPI) anchor assembly protein n=1 Tax=Heterodermia speciosa TaxID=116794 RepID=A0A8H3ECV4_9LECA|nr:MAG: Glycosylphosphatidylinositol (GPI) anchor assembly protein [Heterodermia speciosa]
MDTNVSPPSTTTTVTPPLPKTRKLIPISQPIPILPTSLAQTYTHIHPILLLSLFYLRFPSLVSSPVPTLLSSLIPLSILQLSYAILCLPPSSTRHGLNHDPNDKSPGNNKIESPRPDQLRKRSTPKKDSPDHPFISRIIPALLSLTLTLSLSPPLLFTILILFGAPLTTHLPHTFLLATHVSLLAVLPLFYVHGVNARMWREISSAALPGDEVWGGTVGTMLGAWGGAVPIPLDWYVPLSAPSHFSSVWKVFR